MTKHFNTLKYADLIIMDKWLPNPEIPRPTIDKLLKAFENVTQTEWLKLRWQEVKKLQENHSKTNLNF